MVLRASVALHGRSVTFYEKAFPLSEYIMFKEKAHDQFLVADLASILPSKTPHRLIVSDAGFKSGTVAKLAMRQPLSYSKVFTFSKLCRGAFRPGSP